MIQLEDSYLVALEEFGICEIPGPGSNQRINLYHKSCGQSYDDEVAWCSSFRNFCEEEMYGEGSGTNKPNARSWMKWGVEVDFKNAMMSDTVVFWRESKESWKGHVAFFVCFSKDRTKVLALGGNQSDAVSMKWYPVNRILGIRRKEH